MNTVWITGTILIPALLATAITAAAQESKPAAAPEPAPPFHYNPKDKRDPFMPSREIMAVKDEVCTVDCAPAGPIREPEPLEKFSLESLKFAGTLMAGSEIIAIIEDPSGQAYSVKVGNYMGTSEGQIMEIATGSLVLKEKSPTPKDRQATRMITLKLHRDHDEEK